MKHGEDGLIFLNDTEDTGIALHFSTLKTVQQNLIHSTCDKHVGWNKTITPLVYFSEVIHPICDKHVGWNK